MVKGIFQSRSDGTRACLLAVLLRIEGAVVTAHHMLWSNGNVLHWSTSESKGTFTTLEFLYFSLPELSCAISVDSHGYLVSDFVQGVGFGLCSWL